MWTVPLIYFTLKSASFPLPPCLLQTWPIDTQIQRWPRFAVSGFRRSHCIVDRLLLPGGRIRSVLCCVAIKNVERCLLKQLAKSSVYIEHRKYKSSVLIAWEAGNVALRVSCSLSELLWGTEALPQTEPLAKCRQTFRDLMLHFSSAGFQFSVFHSEDGKW